MIIITTTNNNTYANNKHINKLSEPSARRPVVARSAFEGSVLEYGPDPSELIYIHIYIYIYTHNYVY